jgi:anionic cell wall polymer biosynthesis LytR-Cps2A-Psr (LCP) family protein
MSIDGGDVAMLSFPRDLWVSRCDGSTGRINAATNIGGPAAWSARSATCRASRSTT